MSARRRTPNNAWKPGQSGNPAGRPVGSGRVAQLRESIVAFTPDLIEKLKAQALGGDATAARLLLERALPPVRAVEPPVKLRLPDGTLTDQGRAILAAIGAGELAPAQGASLLAAVGGLARLIEIDDLERRIARLEAHRAPAGSRCADDGDQ
jgi:hypothetical protein